MTNGKTCVIIRNMRFRSPFTRKKPKQNPPKKTTLDQALEKRIIEHAVEDPSWALKAAAKRFNLAIDEEDPVAAKKKEIKLKLAEEGLNRILSDPELRKRYSQMQLDEIMGESEGEELGLPSGSTLEDVLGQLDTIDEIRERLGGKEGSRGWLKEILDSEAGKEMGVSLVQLLLGRQAGQRPVYVVETPGGLVRMDETQFQKYLQDKQQVKLAPPPEVKSIEEIPEPPPPAAIGAPSLNIKEWIEYLERSPEEFVQNLITKANAGDENATFALSILKTKTADEIIEALQPFKTGEAGEAISIIEGNKWWLEAVINLLKESEKE